MLMLIGVWPGIPKNGGRTLVHATDQLNESRPVARHPFRVSSFSPASFGKHSTTVGGAPGEVRS